MDEINWVLTNFEFFFFWVLGNGFVGILIACVEFVVDFFMVGFGFSLCFVGFGLLNLQFILHLLPFHCYIF